MPPNDASAMAAAINQILTNTPLRQRMADAALARARSEFTVATMTQRMLALYEDVLSGKKS